MTNALAEIIKKCIHKDEKAQYQLYKHLFNLMMSVCIRYEKNHDDALSLLNLGFYKVLTNLEKYNVDKSFEGWVKTIMIHTVIDSFRKNKKRLETIRPVDFSENGQMLPTSVLNDVNEYIEEEHLQSMMNDLPDATKAVFNLFAIDGYSHKEISEKLNISVGTSKWHVSKARSTLKKLLIKFQESVFSLIM